MNVKYALIMRGVPGSGKSTLAKLIASKFVFNAIHSTDDLRMVDGKYIYLAEKDAELHAQNLSNFIKSLDKGTNLVVCDNTNVRIAYYEPYVTAARERGYTVAFVEMVHPSAFEAAAVNTHQVPLNVIYGMIQNWEPSQHCVTVNKVNEALATVKSLQNKRKLERFGFASAGAAMAILLLILFSAVMG